MKKQYTAKEFIIFLIFTEEKLLKGPSQPGSVHCGRLLLLLPGKLDIFHSTNDTFVRIFRRGYVLHVIFRLPSKRKLPGRLTWHLDLNEIVAYETTEPLDRQNCERSKL